jgi:hypothetical protein
MPFESHFGIWIDPSSLFDLKTPPISPEAYENGVRRILIKVSKTHFPGLRGLIEFTRACTPREAPARSSTRQVPSTRRQRTRFCCTNWCMGRA